MHESEADVVVVGAGLAGLMAARELRAGGLDVAVLEGRDRVGGRTRNEEVRGAQLEIGGEWVATHHEAMRELCDELGIGLFASFRDGRHVYLTPGGARRLYDDDALPLSARASRELDDAIAALDALAATVDADTPWTAPEAAAWDTATFAAWLEAEVPAGEGRDNLRTLLTGFLAVPAGEVSLLAAVTMIASAGGLHELYDPTRCQADRVDGGSQRVCDVLAAALGDAVVLEQRVHAVDAAGDRVVVQTGDRRVGARRAVLAIAPPLVARVAFSPALPGWRTRLNQKMSFGSVFKVLACYETPFWREQGLSGQGSCADAPVAELYDNSPEDGSFGCLTSFIVAEHARRLGQLPAGDRRDVVLDWFSRYVGDAAAEPFDYREVVWDDEPFTGGGYQCNFGPGGLIASGSDLRRPVGPLHFTGTETAGRGFGHMEGAVRAGRRTAQTVLAELGVRSPA